MSRLAPPCELPCEPDRELLAVIYLPHSYFVTDHKQAWREDDLASIVPGEAPITSSAPPTAETAWAIEEHKRWQMRHQMFPQLRDDTVIFANWNQLYKVSQISGQDGAPLLTRTFFRSIPSFSVSGCPFSRSIRIRFFGSFASRRPANSISRKLLLSGRVRMSPTESFSPTWPTRTSTSSEVESPTFSWIRPR